MSSIRITTPASAAGQGVEGQGIVAQVLALGPGDPFDFRHPVFLDAFLELREERLERFEGNEDRLVQRLIQGRAREHGRFVVPLGHVELLVKGDQAEGMESMMLLR